MTEEQQTGSVESVSGRTRPQMDLFVGLALLLLGVFVVHQSLQMPGVEHRRVGAVYEGPGFVPGLLGVTIAAFGVIVLARSVWEGGLNLKGAGGQVAAVFRRPEPRRLAILLLLSLGYAWGLTGRVSFPMATFPFVLAFILIYDWENAAERAQRENWLVILGKRLFGLQISWSVFRERVLLVVTATIQAALTAWIITYVFENIFLRRLP
ncbi:MAG: tripartite tricarboxylate transporter TctB family protein [Candidatus Hydrogenedentota bacterium]